MASAVFNLPNWTEIVDVGSWRYYELIDAGYTPVDGPVVPSPDPYPQYLTAAELPGQLSGDTPTKTALDAAYARAAKGSNVARFIRRAQSGEPLTITGLGDSVMAGQTVTNPDTDGYMILLAADLATRFTNTVTQTNRAVGGRTLLTAHTFGDVASALTDAADLYLISFGKNDSQIYFNTQGGEYGPGYPRTYSIAAMERLVRRIRDRVPKADVVLILDNPYTTVSADNVLSLYHAEVERLAAQYGCELVDTHAAFKALGDFSALINADGVHPNTAGHRLMADTILEHFPADYTGPAIAPGRPARLATLLPGKVDASKGNGGYVVASSTSVTGLTFTKTGASWTGTAPHVATAAGDYIEYTFTGTELHVNMSLALADAPIFDVAVDGVTVKTGADPRLAGSSIDSYVPVALGLTAAAHTVKITLASGTLRINQAATLAGPGTDLIGDTVSVTVASASAQGLAIDTAGNATALVDVASIPLPAGWNAMDVTLTGFCRAYVQSTTTEKRTVKLLPKINGVIVQNLQSSVGAVPAGEFDFITFPVNHTHRGATAAVTFDLDIYMVSAVKTNTKADEWQIQAVCRRIA